MPQTAIKSIASTKLSVADLNDARTAAALSAHTTTSAPSATAPRVS